jgi:hypothetical protein
VSIRAYIRCLLLPAPLERNDAYREILCASAKPSASPYGIFLGELRRISLSETV